MSSVIKKAAEKRERHGHVVCMGPVHACLGGTAIGTGTWSCSCSWHCEAMELQSCELWAMSGDRAKKFATSHFRACFIFLVRQHVVLVVVVVAVVVGAVVVVVVVVAVLVFVFVFVLVLLCVCFCLCLYLSCCV